MSLRFIPSLTLGLILFLFSSTSIHAATWYVSPGGNDSRNGETESTAWKTIQYAVTQKNKVRPGDTILILPGTYREAVVMNGSTKSYEGQNASSSVEGTNAQPITIKGANANNPPTITNGRDKMFQWLVIDVSNVTFENIEFKDYYYSGFKVFAENKPVSNVTAKKLRLINQQVPDFTRAGWQGYFGILFSATDNAKPITNARVENNYLERIVTKDPDGSGHECIRFNGEVNKSTIQNNTIDTCSGLGIDILGKDNPPGYLKAQPNYIVVRNNNIKDMYRMKIAEPTAIYLDKAGNFTLIENNSLNSNLENAQLVKINVEPVPGNLDGYGDSIVRGNLKYGQGKGAVIGIGAANLPDNSVQNNKFIDRVAIVHNTWVSTNGSVPIFYSGSRFTSAKNNVFTTTGDILQQFSNWLGQFPALNVNNRESNGNLWHTNNANPKWEWGPNTSYTGFNNYKSQTSQDTQSFFANPQFVNTSAQNYQLKSGTPGHNQGIDLTKTTAPGTNTRTVPVEDTKYFYDGWGIEGEVGDKIMVGSTQVRITNVNHATKTLTVDRTITYANNTPVNYYYEGSRPTMGLLPVAFYDKGDVTTTPTPTPTGSSNTPTPTTPPSCPSFSQGNATCDSGGVIDLTDFTCWKGEFLTGTAPGGCPGGADFDTSGSVDILDFTIWQVSYARG